MTTLLQSLRVAAFLAIPLMGHALEPQELPTPISSTDRAGLQITLKTGGYRFTVGTPPSVAQPTQGDSGIIPPFPWLRESFPASVTLSNRSNSDLRFRFETAEAAAQRFVFRVFNSAGDKLWESVPVATPLSPAADELLVTLPRRGTWRRLVQVPLRIAGAPLPAGVYTLEALIDADKQMGATALFEVAAQELPPPATGIKGLVLRPTGIPPESASPLPNEVPAAGATVQIVEVGNPLTLRPVRQWTAHTDATGRFQVIVPPGPYRVIVESLPATAWPPNNSDDPTAPLPPQVTLPPTVAKVVEASVEQGRITELTIHLVRAGGTPPAEPRLIYGIEDVDILPSALAEINSAVVHARGVVRTGGWTNSRLRSRGVTNAGVVEFDFVAVPPSEAAIQVISRVEASAIFRKPDNFHGVRVFAETNSKEALVQ